MALTEAQRALQQRLFDANVVGQGQTQQLFNADGSVNVPWLRARLIARKEGNAYAGYNNPEYLAKLAPGDRARIERQKADVDALLNNYPEGSIGPSQMVTQAIPQQPGTFNPVAAATTMGLDAAKLGFGVGGVLLGGAAVGATAYALKRRKSSRRRSSPKKGKRKAKRSGSRRLKFGSPAWRKRYMKKGRRKKYGTAKQYRRPGGKSVKYTKNGQPYIILRNGKARFIKGRRKR